jgi:hypothetical protein
MRATRGNAASAAARVSGPPIAVAIANANNAGSFFGALPLSDTCAMVSTVFGPSVIRHWRTAPAASCVNSRSPT